MAVDIQTLALEMDTGGLARGEKQASTILDRLADSLDAIVAKSQQMERAVNAALSFKTSGNAINQAARNTATYADALDKTATAQQKAADAALRHEQAFARLLQAQGKNADAIKVLERALDGFTGSQIQATRAQIQLTNLQNNYANSPLIGAVRGQSAAFGDLNANVNQAAAGFTGAAQAGNQSESGFRKLIGTVGTLAGIFSDLSSGFFFFNSQRKKISNIDLSATQSDAVDAVAATQSVVRGASKALEVVQKLRTEGAGALRDIFKVPTGGDNTVTKAAEQATEKMEKAAEAAKDFGEAVRDAFTGNRDTSGLLERLRVANENSKAAFRAIEEEERAEKRRRRLAEEAAIAESARAAKLRAQLEENARIRAKTIAQEAAELRAAEALRAREQAKEENLRRARALAAERAANEQAAIRALPLGQRARRAIVEFIRDERGEASVLQGLQTTERATTRTAARIRSALRSAFQPDTQAGKSLFESFRGGDGVLDRLAKGFSGLRERGASAFAEMGVNARNAGLAIGALGVSIGVVTAGFLALTASIAASVPVLIALGAAGIRANAQFEQTRIGIASIVSSVATLRDSRGVKLEGIDALNAALPIARKQLDAIRVDALQTALEFKDIAPAFLQAVGPGLAAGLNLDQVRKTVIDVSQLIVPLTGDASQLGQELRSIFSGDIGPDSGVARALQITKQQIDAAKEAGKLAEFLNEKLKAASATGRLMANTFEAAASNLKEAGTVLAATVTEGLFDALKTRINETLPRIFEIAGGQVNIAPAFKGVADALTDVFNRAGAVFGEALNGAFQAAKGLSAFLAENRDKLNEIVTGGAELVRAMGALGLDAGKLVGIVIKLSGAFKLVTLQLELAAGILNAIDSILQPILAVASAIGEAFSKLPKIFGEARDEAEATRLILAQAGNIKIEGVEARGAQIKALQSQIEAAKALTNEQASVNEEQERYRAILATLTTQQQAIVSAYGTQQERLTALRAILGSALEAQQALSRAQQSQLIAGIAAQQLEIEKQQQKNAELDKEIVLRDKLLQKGEQTRFVQAESGFASGKVGAVLEDLTARQQALTDARLSGAKAVEELNKKQAESITTLRAMLPQLNQTEQALLADVQAGKVAVGTYDAFKRAVDAAKASTADATLVVNDQANAVDRLTISLDRLNQAANTEVDKRIKQIALTARTEAEAKTRTREALKNDDDFFFAVQNKNRVAANLKAASEIIEPRPTRTGGSRAGRAKELTELEQLTKQLREAEKDVSLFQNVASKEFGLRIQLEDTRRFKSQLEEIISLRRELNEPLRAALPADKRGADREIENLKALKELREAEAKFNPTAAFQEAQQASIKATADQVAALDKLINDALPKTEDATVAAALAQNEYFLALEKTNPALAEYYRQQAQAADATNAAARAQEAFNGLQEQLTGKLDRFRNLTEQQATALELQKEKYAGLSEAQKEQLLSQAAQIDQQDALQRAYEESARVTEQFAATTKDLFTTLFTDGPKAFAERTLDTFKRLAADLAAQFATNGLLRLLGLAPQSGGGLNFGGSPAFAGAGGGGGFGLPSLLGLGGGGQSSGGGLLGSLFGGGSNGNFLTGGFAGGNPAAVALGGGKFSGALGGIPLLGKLFGGGASSIAPILGGGGFGAGGAGLGAAGAAGGTGGFASLGAFFTNPLTAIIGGGIAATLLGFKLFGGGDFKKFQKAVDSTYAVKIEGDKEGKSVFEQSKQIGEQAFGKGKFKDRLRDIIALKDVKDLIAAYGEATGQDNSPLVKRATQIRDLSSVGNSANNFVRRAMGGLIPLPYFRGGFLGMPDTGRDSVLTALRGGEYVTRPEATRAQGIGRFDALNAGRATILTYDQRGVGEFLALLESGKIPLFSRGMRERLAGALRTEQNAGAEYFTRRAAGGYVPPPMPSFATGGYVPVAAPSSAPSSSNAEMTGLRVVVAQLAEAVASLTGIPYDHVVSRASDSTVLAKVDRGLAADTTTTINMQRTLGVQQ